MGAYLGAPNIEKTSHDESHSHLEFGLSGMQGWRMSMEDAYCCLPDIDKKKNSMFGVFDGHGGREVAEYCAQNFHKFLLDVDAYSEGDIKTALSQAFMTIDEAITSDEVIAELKVLSGCVDEDADDEEEANMLLEEANMPIEELLSRLKGSVKEKLVENGILQNDVDDENDVEDEIKEEKINGHIDAVENNTSISSKSRKQKNPVKRNLDESDQENPSHPVSNTSPNPISSNSIDVLSSTSSKSASSSSVTVISSSDPAEPDVSSASTSAEDLPTNTSPSSSTGASIGNISSSLNALVEDDDDNDFDANEDDDEDEEGVEDDEEEGSSSDDDDDEFEDSEGVDFQPPASDEVGKESGTTAVVAILHNNRLYVANAGDSRCVLCRNGKALEMSFDHKPEDDIEKTRIEKAGGTITMDGRVNGGLNLSRAIGDHAYKQNKNIPLEEQAITACPDIKEIDLTNEDSFMVLACDGIWNVMTNEEVVEFINMRLNSNSEEKPKLSKICEDLLDQCLAPNTDNDGSGCDNMTCVIVRFKHDDNTKLTSGSHKRTTENDNSDLNQKSLKRPKVSSE